MSHLNNSKFKFTVLTKIEASSSQADNNTSIGKFDKIDQFHQIQPNTNSQSKDHSKRVPTQLAPARYTLHRFGVEVTQFGIGDGLGWDLTSIYRNDGLNLKPMLLYPGDVLELVQPEICVVPRKVDDFMESRKHFFQGKLLICIANDHHLSLIHI